MSNRRPIRILLADDHQIVRQGLRQLLDLEPDMEVVEEASDGREAVEAAKRARPDVAIVDLSMPELNGIEATRQIAEAGLKIRVLCLSMHKEQKMIGAMLRAGAAGYLLKSCAARELAQAVRTVARGETFLSTAVAGSVVDQLLDRSGSAETAFATLTPRELQVLQLIAEGLSAKEAGGRLGISQKTVLAHRRNIMDKLDLHSTAELARYALREGVTEL